MLSIVLLTIGLWNAEMERSEKGFYAMSFVLSLFAAIAVQKKYKRYKANENEYWILHSDIAGFISNYEST